MQLKCFQVVLVGCRCVVTGHDVMYINQDYQTDVTLGGQRQFYVYIMDVYGLCGRVCVHQCICVSTPDHRGST